MEKERTVLEEANEIIYGERRGSYGTPFDNFSLTAKLWEPILKCPVTPEQVALCMIQLKVARELHVHKRDNCTDIAGYVGTLMEVHEERRKRQEAQRYDDTNTNLPCCADVPEADAVMFTDLEENQDPRGEVGPLST